MNKTLTIIIAAALLAGSAWYLTRPAADTPSSAPAAGRAAMPVTAPREETGLAETEPASSEQTYSMPPAKRIRHGTAREQPSAGPVLDLPPSGDEKVNRLNRRLEKALEGDIDELLGIARLINQCDRGGMGSEEQLQQRLDRLAEFQSRNPSGPSMPGRGRGGSVEYESFEDMEAQLWAQFDACRTSQEVLDETLHEQVARLADTGVPSARYLYAVWPPNQDSIALVDTLELLEYQNLALEYSWANMQERNPLGLLAMSQSYSARRPSMFTPSNGILGQVFLLASMKCGVDNEWLEERSMNFGQGFSRFQSRNMEMPSLEEDATALAEMFCPVEAED